jgi:hypothetical protein
MAAYEDALNALRTYLGPAAQKFLDRQVDRLGVPKEDLAAHMGDLAESCRSSAALVLDEAKAAEIEQKLRGIV